ncbi:MAG: hypothetical protein M3O35_12040 [Acidobacteriota bacterium]|nr:hypothetical protein [Acidobacteriota bacterium]
MPRASRASSQRPTSVETPGYFYVIDDMLPQPNWPDYHLPKVSALIATLVAWVSGIVVAVRKTT